MTVRYSAVVLAGLTAALLVAPEAALWLITRVWAQVAALFGAALLLAVVRGVGALRWLARLALVLPAEHRRAWRGEMVAVLDACADPAQRRRQVRAYVAALPATAWTCWQLRAAGALATARQPRR